MTEAQILTILNIVSVAIAKARAGRRASPWAYDMEVEEDARFINATREMLAEGDARDLVALRAAIG